MSASPSCQPVSVLRGGLAVLCAILAGLGFALWLGLTWIQAHVLSPGGFRDTAAAVVAETSFQDELVQTVLDRATLKTLSDVGTGIAPLDRAVETLRERAVDAAQSWLTAPEQQGTWVQLLDDTHAANVPLTPSAGHAPENLVVDASALGAAADAQVQRTLGLDPGISDQQLTITVPGVRSGPVVDALVWCAEWRYVLPWLVGALAVVCLISAPRRWAALAGVGLSGVVFTAALLAVVLGAAHTLVAASGADPVAHLVTEQIVGQLRESFIGCSVTGILWAAAVAVVGVIGTVVTHRAVAYHGGHVHRR